MRNIILKELKLSASPITYIFILFSLMFFVPGYPVLCGAFFVTFGVFHSFQSAREANDILFTSLLPITKKDVVKGKYIFVCLIELCALALMSVVTALRMTLLAESAVYKSNALMNVNLFTLGAAALIFGVFNTIFVGGFFKTAYKFSAPFVKYLIAVFFLIGAAEALHHLPGFEAVNSFGCENIALELILFTVCSIISLTLTMISYKRACMNFEKIDL